MGSEYVNYYLFMLYPYKRGYDDERDEITPKDVIILLDELKKIGKQKSNEKIQITLILDSIGGDIYAAYKIIKLIRNKCDKLIVFIPERAKSAATLMALGADEIVMGVESELGPLDLPMREHPLLENVKDFSALDGVRPLTLLYDAGKNLAVFNLGLDLRKKVELSREDSVKIALDFSVNYLKPILSKLDPWVYSKCYRLLLIAVEYAKELLFDYMFKEYPSEIKKEKAEKIARELVFDFPEHGFVINRDCAKKRLFLNIKNSEAYLNLAKFSEQLIHKSIEEKTIKINKKLELK